MVMVRLMMGCLFVVALFQQQQKCWSFVNIHVIQYDSCTRAGIELLHQNGISGDDADQDPPKENLEEGDAD